MRYIINPHQIQIWETAFEVIIGIVIASLVLGSVT